MSSTDPKGRATGQMTGVRGTNKERLVEDAEDRSEKATAEQGMAQEKKAWARESLLESAGQGTKKLWDGLKEAGKAGAAELGKKMLLYAGIMAAGLLLVTVPVILIVGALYSSPFALLLPDSGDGSLPRIEDVTEGLYEEFEDIVREACIQGERATGQRYEIDAGSWDVLMERANAWDVMSVYMVRYAQGERAIDMNAKGQKRLREVFGDMVGYYVSERTEYVLVTDEEVVKAVYGETESTEDADKDEGEGVEADGGTEDERGVSATQSGGEGAAEAGNSGSRSEAETESTGDIGTREIDLSKYSYIIVNGKPQVYEIINTHILRITLRYAEDMAEEYEFTEEQRGQLQQLLSKTL